MKEVTKKKRMSNIELLRIISMFFIVCHHMMNYSGLGRENLVFCIINTLVSPCVNIFVLITGYFLAKSEFKIKKFVKLYLQIIFYYLFCTFFFRYVFNVVGILHKEDLISAIFPILYPQEWFSICYMILYVLSPFLNKMINNLSKKEHVCLILILLVFSYFQRYIGFDAYLKVNYGYSVIWFITLYVIAAYIRFYLDEININKKRLLLCILILFLSIFIFYHYNFSNIYITPLFINSNYIAYSSVFVLTVSVLTFILFKNINIKSKKIGNVINKIASTTFAVYLIHSTNFSRVFFDKIVKLSIEYFGYKLLPVYLFVIVIAIFEVGVIIECLRQIMENKIEKIVKIFKEKYSKKGIK